MRWILLLSALLAACSSTPNRAPVVTGRAHPPRVSQVQVGADWRPDTYVVKRGDTLFGIALEFGLDYKELADWNGITDINKISAGRELRLTAPHTYAVTRPLQQSAPVTSPMSSPAPAAAQNLPAPAASAAPAGGTSFVKSGPVGLEVPYTQKALAQMSPVQAAPAPAPAAPQPAEQPAAAASDGSWGWPAQGKVVSGFSETANLKGIDIAGKMGQPIFASASGKVVYTGSGLRGYGKLIIVKHDKTYLSAYAHNSKLLVKEGDMVKKGEEIAEMGNTDADKVELHFEIRRYGKPVDPMTFLKANDTGTHR